MQIAINTDFLGGTRSPKERLKAIAEAGFTHLHWCHHWCTDFFYSRSELTQYAAWLREFGLQLLDVHGSAGDEKFWYSTEEYVRLAGVELVTNRIIMLRELGGTGSLIMHFPAVRDRAGFDPVPVMAQFEAVKRSMDSLMPVLEQYDVRMTVENLPSDTFELIGRLMADSPEKYMGITYDSGHGNIAEGKGMERLEPWKNRLQALHLNDNDGTKDQHQPPFYGTVDWRKMVKILSESPCAVRPLSFELSMCNTPFYEKELTVDQKPEKIRAFLADAYDRCARVVKLFEQAALEKSPASA